MSRIKHISIVFAAGFLLLAAAPSASAAPAGSTASSLLRAVNAARASHGVRPLRLDARLARAARSHSLDMVRRNYFSHGDFASRMRSFSLSGSLAENLAWGSGPYGAATSIVRMWLNSPGHRANLLDGRYSRLGLGIVRGTFQGTGGATVVTADFGG